MFKFYFLIYRMLLLVLLFLELRLPYCVEKEKKNYYPGQVTDILNLTAPILLPVVKKYIQYKPLKL